MLRPPNELLGFVRNKIKEQKIKSFYSLEVSRKPQHNRNYQILVGKLHKFYRNKPEANTRENTLHLKKYIHNIQR
jgi:hypothetical protein